MKLTDEAVNNFADLWEKEFGEILPVDEARRKAAAFLDLCWMLVQPLPGEPGHLPHVTTPLT